MLVNIDFDYFSLIVTPPNHRDNYFIAWIRGLYSQIKRKYKIFTEFCNGTTSTYWNVSTVYSFEQEAIIDYKVYKSLINGNVGNTPSSSPDSWELILDSPIGVYESATYSCKKLVLEFALNKFFIKQLLDNGFIGYRTPDSPLNPTNSDIYIQDFTPPVLSFVSFDTENGTSYSSDLTSDTGSFDVEILSGASTYFFKVFIPLSVYSSIGDETIIRNFINQYVPPGLLYTIQTY